MEARFTDRILSLPSNWCVMVPLILHQLAIGFVLNFPAVLIPAIMDSDTSNGSKMHVTMTEASWIGAAYIMTGGISFLILPPLMQLYGRRFINATINLIIFLGWIIIALSPNVPTVIAGRALQGLSFGGLYICSILAGEYSHPKRRGFFIIFQVTATSIGELICHGLGFTLSWRQIAFLASIPPALAALGTIAWPESPSWLAYKGRSDECVTSFEWLRGKDIESKRELKELITAQQKLRNIKILKNSGLLMRNLQAMKSKEFLKPLTVVLMLIILTQVCGNFYLTAYEVHMRFWLTWDEFKAYYLVMKILVILSSSYIVRIFKRRALLLQTGNLACILLSSVCIFHLLVRNEIISQYYWLTPLLLLLHNIICYIGVIPVSMVLIGELFPIEYKGLGPSVSGLFYIISTIVLIESTGTMLYTLDIPGTFAFYLIIAVASLVCLYYILPETKDRTLQDIELEFMDMELPKDDNGFKTSKVVNHNLLVSK